MVPLQFGFWNLSSDIVFQGTIGNPRFVSSTSTDSRTDSTLVGAPPGLDIDAAMSKPTCGLREGLMSKLCEPTIVRVDGF
jgi:hypothetical protein